MHFTGTKSSPKILSDTPNLYNVSSQRYNLIKLKHYDETKERAHDSQITKAKENLKLSHGEPSLYCYMVPGSLVLHVHSPSLANVDDE